MGPSLLLALLAFTLTAALLPFTYRGLRWLGVLDVAADRSSHIGAVVRGGGIGCGVGVGLAALVAESLGYAMPWLLLLGVSALWIVGLLDDMRGLPAGQRLILQVIIGLALGGQAGVAWALTGAILVPVIVNTVNFMDGINGITALTTTAWAICVLLAPSATATQVTLAAFALGSLLAFLPWNLPRARMFVGDSGSYLVGGIVSVSVLGGVDYDNTKSTAWLALAPLLPYLFDTGITLARRARRHAPIMDAHREHLYQQLVRSGWPHAWAALLVAGLALGVGLVWVWLTPLLATVTSVVLLTVYIGTGLRAEGKAAAADSRARSLRERGMRS